MEEPRPDEEDRPHGGEEGAAPDREASTERPPTPVTQQIGRAMVVVLIVLFGVFAVSNAQPVDFSWIFGSTEVADGPGEVTEGGVPLIVLLLASFVIGAIVGGVLAWQTGRARRRNRDAAQ